MQTKRFTNHMFSLQYNLYTDTHRPLGNNLNYDNYEARKILTYDVWLGNLSTNYNYIKSLSKQQEYHAPFDDQNINWLYWKNVKKQLRFLYESNNSYRLYILWLIDLIRFCWIKREIYLILSSTSFANVR